MEDTADRQQAIQSIKSSANDLIDKVKSKEHEGLPEEERIKIDGKNPAARGSSLDSDSGDNVNIHTSVTLD